MKIRKIKAASYEPNSKAYLFCCGAEAIAASVIGSTGLILDVV